MSPHGLKNQLSLHQSSQVPGGVCVRGWEGGLIGPSTDLDICVEASKQLELCKIASPRMRRSLTANLYNFLTIPIPLSKCMVL